MNKKILAILVGVIFIGTILFFSFNKSVNEEEMKVLIKEIYNENEQIINVIKDELMSKNGEMYVYYQNGEVVCDNVNFDEETKNNIALYFTAIDEKLDSAIRIRELFGERVIEFSFYDKRNKMDRGIIYTSDTQGYDHIENNWYVYSYGLV